MKRHVSIAADFGGGSGRLVAGWLENGKLLTEELHRFHNAPVKDGNHTRWDFPYLFEQLVEGLKVAVERDLIIDSIGVDTWGVDFGLMDADGNLLGQPICYRDWSSDRGLEYVKTQISDVAFYKATGLPMIAINSVNRMALMQNEGYTAWNRASQVLFMPDLFTYFLCGEIVAEFSIASTSGLLDPETRNWNVELLDRLSIPSEKLPDIVMPGTVVGTLVDPLKHALGIDYDIKVIAVAGHDTESAVYAVRESLDNTTAFLSSGTWSLLGVELPEPVLTEKALNDGFANEGSVDGRICLLQNITGMWILQGLVKEWKEEGLTHDYSALLAMAEESDFDGEIDVDDAKFTNPENMTEAIRSCFPEGEAPVSQGDFGRCVCKSLARRYTVGIAGLNALLPSPVKRLLVFGGGCRNYLVNQFTAEMAGVEVVTGPVEATAEGNIKLQINTLAELK